MAWILFRYCVCAQLPSLQIEIHRYYLAVCSAELEPQQQSTDQKLSLKRSCVACHLHQTGSSHVVDSQSNKWHAQIELFPLYGWKACIRWQLDDLPNATQWFILQDWVEIHEFPMQQSTRLNPCLYRLWLKICHYFFHLVKKDSWSASFCWWFKHCLM